MAASGDPACFLSVIRIKCTTHDVAEERNLVKLQPKETFEDLEGTFACNSTACMTVALSKTEEGSWTTLEESDSMYKTPISDICARFGYLFLRIKCVTPHPETKSSSSSCIGKPISSNKNAFDLLMSNQKQRTEPPKKTVSARVKEGLSRKDELYNDMVDLFSQKQWKFTKTVADLDGVYIVQTLTNALWYITNQHLTIEDASHHKRDVVPVPEIFQAFQGYNDVKRKKMKEQPMNSRTLESHAQALFTLCAKPCLQSVPTLKHELIGLSECLQKYATHLQVMLREQQARQRSTLPVRQLSDSVSIEHRHPVNNVKECYRRIDELMKNSNILTPVQCHEDFCSTSDRYRYIQGLHLSVPVDLLRYSPGGSHVTVVFLCRVENNRTSDEEKVQSVQFYEKVRKDLPVFHTRQMKRAFKLQFQDLSKITPSLLETVYQQLTLDSSVHSNPSVNERLRLIFLGETGLLPDLRALNTGRPLGTYDCYFQKFGEVINDFMAADDRRHGEAHLAPWTSLRDLMEETGRRLDEDTPVPSSALVRIQFTPKNPYSHAALRFTSKFDIQYKIQRRQLRASHPDQHFCNALLKYMKEFVISNREDVVFFCADDKAKVPFGEPGHVLSTGVRGKTSICPTSTTLVAEDHDVHKLGSLTPSVYLKCDLPRDSSGSFHKGQVYVTVNDTVFQPSNPFRHAATLVKILKQEDQIPKIFVKYSDGGTDQRNTIESVKVSLIAMFKALDLDFLVVARCAPSQSWCNPAERVMSVLNIALQNCALERPSADAEMERLIAKSSNLKDLRTCENMDVRNAWTTSVAQLQNLVSGRFSRLQVANKPIKPMDSLDLVEINELHNIVKELFPGISLNELTKTGLKKIPAYHAWLLKHCRIRHYSFQIRKCADESCCGGAPPISTPWLPDPQIGENDHYKAYSEVVHQETNDTDRPSARPVRPRSSAADKQPLTKRRKTHQEQEVALDPYKPDHDPHMFTTQNAKHLVECVECRKPRVIYAKHRLTSRQEMMLTLLLSAYEYSCGSPIAPADHSLFKVIHVRSPMNCSDAVELAYYGSGMGRNDICPYCLQEETPSKPELRKKFKTVVEICACCAQKGLKDILYRPYGKC